MRKHGRGEKKISMFMIAIMACLSIHAVPAKRGIWKTITLDDGTRVHAELRGDEHGHFLMDRNGNTYTKNDRNTYSLIKGEETRTSTTHRPSLTRPRRLIGIPTDKSLFQGKKKGIVILAQFPAGSYTENGETVTEQAVSFSEDTPTLLGCNTTKQLYEKIINQRDLGNDPLRGPFTGSVKDYFIDQSQGQFELDFDIVGPYTLSHCHHYYGANVGDNDAHPGEMAYEAVNHAIADGTDFTLYDWDGDNVVDQVFILFAGQGEADGGNEDCIWPHEHYLASTYQSITTSINGKRVTINQYACSNELATNGKYESTSGQFIANGTQIAGIGTICHEFSHCFGYPDMYDIAYENYGMGTWDIMDEGTYNGTWNGGHDDWEELKGGYQPAGYTAFEKWCAGWIEPIVLDSPQKITDILPLNSNGDGTAYVIYMPESQQSIEGEYYLIENRQQQGWDTSLPWHGLQVTYVHYDKALWRNNCLNCTNEQKLKSRQVTNTHRRVTIFQAGGNDPGFLSLDTYPYQVDCITQLLGSEWGTTGIEIATNLNNRYEAKGLNLNLADNNTLTDSSTPQAYYWSSYSSAQPLTNHELWDIQENGDDMGSMSFVYKKLEEEKVLALDQDTPEPQAIATGLYSSATINRQLSSGNYNTLWLPFSMNANEIHACWGDSTEIYRLTDVTVDDEGKFVLNITEDTKNGIHAFEPILIKTYGNAKQETTTFNHYIQINDAINHTEPITVLDNGWKFVGTKSDGYVPEGARFLKENKHYMAGDSTTRIRAYRAYFIAPEGNDTTLAHSNSQQMPVAYHITKPMEQSAVPPIPINTSSIESLFFHPQDILPTRIMHKATSIQHDPSHVYDLSGRKVIKPQSKGFYIIYGKKWVR